MQSLFPETNSGEKTLIQFPAGKCVMTLQANGKYNVTADDRRGNISLVLLTDQTVHFRWSPLPSGKPEDDRIVFPGENVFKKVNTGRENDRVYMLQYVTGNQRFMFWMQEKSPENDEDRLKKVNEFINNPNAGNPAPAAGASATVGPNEWMQLLGLPPPAGGLPTATAVPPAAATNTTGYANLDLSSLLNPRPAAATTAPAAPTAASSAAAAPAVSIEDLQRAMFGSSGGGGRANRGAAAPATPALQDIFLGEEILNSGILNDPEVVSELVADLPPEQRSAQHLESTLRSAQFQQALGSLTHAVQHPDNYQSVVSNFNIDPAAGMNQLIAGDGVGAFLTAVQSDVSTANNQRAAAVVAESKEDSKEGEGEDKKSSE